MSEPETGDHKNRENRRVKQGFSRAQDKLISCLTYCTYIYAVQMDYLEALMVDPNNSKRQQFANSIGKNCTQVYCLYCSPSVDACLHVYIQHVGQHSSIRQLEMITMYILFEFLKASTCEFENCKFKIHPEKRAVGAFGHFWSFIGSTELAQVSSLYSGMFVTPT